MSISYLQESRTLYRKLLETELAKGSFLLQKGRVIGDIKDVLQNVNSCISKLNNLQQNLEDVGERMSIVIEGQEGEGEIIDLIQDDWDYLSTVMDCRDELADLQISLRDQVSSKENIPSITSTENSADPLEQLNAIMHKGLLGQQQLQNQMAMAKSNGVKMVIVYGDRQTEETALCTKLGGDLSLGGGPRLGRNLSLKSLRVDLNLLLDF